VSDARRDFFISYTSADEDWAEWIAHVLEEAGYTVVIQKWDFRPGSNFVIEMQKALEFSDRLIAVLSPGYLAARFPQPEWAAVFAADPEGAQRRLVPVMVKRCEPTGLLCQVVQIRIHDLELNAAQARLLDGVRSGRAKPAAPPAFPGRSEPAPGASPQSSVTRLVWHRAQPPTDVTWRAGFENRLPYQSGYEAVELHLVPVDDDARLQVRDLALLANSLPDIGRRAGIFSPTEALDARSDGANAFALSRERGAVAGLGVTRFGQRSAWIGLPRDSLGAILDETNLAQELARLLATLAKIDVPVPTRVIPFVGVEPAGMVSVGRVEDLPRTSAQLGHGMPQNIRPTADEAVDFSSIHVHGAEIAAELAARLAAEHKRAARL